MNMKKLHSFAFCAMVTPVITLGASSLLAQQSADQDCDCVSQSSQSDRAAARPTTRATQADQNTQRAGQSDSQAAAKRLKANESSRANNQGLIGSTPAKGMRAGNLIGAKVKTTGGEEVGPVDDLIIDQDGQVLAIVVGVGGFLGIGERNVAIGWNEVTKSGTADERELRIDMTREDLRAAPEFKEQD